MYIELKKIMVILFSEKLGEGNSKEEQDVLHMTLLKDIYL